MNSKAHKVCVVVNFVCYCDWATDCPEFWSNKILGVSLRVFLNEVNIWIGKMSKANCQCGWPSSNPLKTWTEQDLVRILTLNLTYLALLGLDFSVSIIVNQFLILSLIIYVCVCVCVHIYIFMCRCIYYMCFPSGTSGKEPACQCRRLKRCGFNPWVGKIPWRRTWNPLQYSCLENPLDRGA